MERYGEEQVEVERAGAQPAKELAALAEEVRRLRRAVLRQEHAQELFQGRVEEALGGRAGGGAAVPASPAGRPLASALSPAQLRALLELDQALLSLAPLAAGGAGAAAAAGPVDAPASLREGLSLLQIRVRNLQHSFGLEPIAAAGLPFDDRWHQVQAVVRRPELPDRWVVEEVLPGYRLGEKVLRPARVVVNRLDGPPAAGEADPQG